MMLFVKIFNEVKGFYKYLVLWIRQKEKLAASYSLS